MKKINGVNLGNWLVLEKWMCPALFDGTTAEDEYYLAHQLPPQMFEMRLKLHRSEYITERDFAHIAHNRLSDAKRKQLYRSIAQAELDAWNQGSGHYYWNYKLLLDPTNDPNWYGWDCWDLGKSVAEGWFPVSSET